jgi:hypothetical protein
MTPEIVLHRVLGAEHQLAIVAAIVFGVFDADAVEALLDRAGGFVGGQNALGPAPPWLRDFVQSARFIVVSLRSLASLRLLYAKRLDAGKRLALEPFEECATGGGYISEAVGRARVFERRDRVAAARNRT